MVGIRSSGNRCRFQAARKANNDVAKRDLQSEADDAASRSSDLLSDAQELADQRTGNLEEAMQVKFRLKQFILK